MCSIADETAGDQAFLDDLAIACSPLAGLLSPALLRQQAVLQRIGHAAAFPAAMRCIVLRDRAPIGHLAIDWGAGESRCVDIAILPAAQGLGLGTALLAAWLATADRLGLAATLAVRTDNPALALYRRLGLAVVGEGDGPILAMARRR